MLIVIEEISINIISDIYNYINRYKYEMIDEVNVKKYGLVAALLNNLYNKASNDNDLMTALNK